MGSASPMVCRGIQNVQAYVKLCGAIAAFAIILQYSSLLSSSRVIAAPDLICGLTWDTVAHPSLGSAYTSLRGVAAVSGNDVWAVGGYGNISGPGRTLTEHWDGSTWSVIPSPNVGNVNNGFQAVDAISSADIWAVGSVEWNQPLTAHWNGIDWSIVPNPFVGPNSVLEAVEAISPSDVWAVGLAGSQSLVEHWDGITWSVIPSPVVGTNTYHLQAISAVSSSDIWAVGSYYTTIGYTPLIEHWNGANWGLVESPIIDSGGSYLVGVAVVSANDVWAVGSSYDSSTSLDQPLIEHWDGTSWSVAFNSSVGTGGALLGISAVSANDVWAVGYASRNPLVMHWDGIAWTVVPSPSFPSGPIPFGFSSVSAAYPADIWAAGGDLVERGACTQFWFNGLHPRAASSSQSTVLTVNGSHFVPTPTLRLGESTNVPVTYLSSSMLSATIPSGLPTGWYTATLTNPGGPAVSVSNALFVEGDAPIGTIVVNGGQTFANNSSVSLSMSASDVGSGLTQMSFSNDGTTWTEWQGYAVAATWTLPTGDGTKTVYARFRDQAGNISAITDDDIVLDTLAPSVSVTPLNAYQASLAFPVAWSGSDPTSGLFRYDVQRRDGATGIWTNWQVAVVHATSDFTGQDGHTYYFRARAWDNAGNASPFSSGNTQTTVDITPPIGSITILSGGGANKRQSMSAVLGLTAFDAVSGVGSMMLSNDPSFAGTNWESFATTRTWTLGSDNTVYVRFRDNAGNVSQTYSAEEWRLMLPLLVR